MKPIEPGDEFEIEYGNGHRLTVKALNGRTKRKIAALSAQAQNYDMKENGVEGFFDLAEEVLWLAVPDQAEELAEKTDEQQQFQIAANVMLGAALSSDDRKKSGSRRSSDAGRSVEPVRARAKTRRPKR